MKQIGHDTVVKNLDGYAKIITYNYGGMPMGEILNNIQVEGIVSAIGGGLIFIYAMFLTIQKICENFGWFTKKQREKKAQQKEGRREEFNEFMKPYNDKMEQITKDLQQQNLSQMRIEMDKIYELYRCEKAWPRAIRTEFLRLYNMYQERGGNHYITTIIYPEVMTWEVID